MKVKACHEFEVYQLTKKLIVLGDLRDFQSNSDGKAVSVFTCHF